jgi:hypothetical protein
MTGKETTIRNNALIRTLALIACAALWLTACAGDSIATGEEPVRPVISMFTADFGQASILDTYLTPIRYNGYNVALGYESLQAMKHNPDKLIRELDAGVDYNHVKNPAGNHTMHSLMVDFKWGMMRRWHDVWVNKLQLMAGGSAQFRGGVIYNANNANNVVSIKMNFSLNLAGMAVYNTHAWSTPLTLRYEATIPVVGAFFSPDYDESYYEIYVGNHSGLVHMGWWGNRFDMQNLVCADFHFGNTVLRVGYRNRMETSWINHINTHFYTNSFVIGVGGEFLSLGGHKKLNAKTKIISAMY